MSFIDHMHDNVNIDNNNFIIPKNQDKVDIVISKFNENLSYINHFKNVYIYDKNPINSLLFYKYVKPDIHYTQVPNVGREIHTYLYHIINNYDNLNDITIFIHGSCIFENRYKLELYNKLVYIYNNTGNTVFFGMPVSILSLFKDIKMTYYKSTTNCNNIFDIKHTLKEYNGNYYDWYIENFKNIEVYCGSYAGTLLIHKNDILKHPKEYYQKLIKYVDEDNNPETAHYFERSWGAVFHPIDKKCIFNYSDVRDIQI